jgi:hypothetical protein
VELLEQPGPHPVVLAQQAAEAYSRMNPRDRYELRVAVVGGKWPGCPPNGPPGGPPVRCCCPRCAA